MTVIEAPEKFRSDVNVWVDEAIWGHRFYNDQTPWLVFLEFLSVFRDRQLNGKALNETRVGGNHEAITYHLPRLVPLRELIFNNPQIQHIETVGKSDAEKWASWTKQFNGDHDYEYLQRRFGEFSKFARVVEFFQNTAVEPHRQRRWTSRFLFPYGPYCLYADLPGNSAGSPDRRFFARGGELLYLMLARSGQGPELSSLIGGKLFQEDDSWNRVARALLPEDYRIDSNSIPSSIGYLPYAERSEYGALADTWRQLLSLNLPGATLLDPIVRLSSLHMLLYMLRRANEEIGDTSEPKFVLEIAAPKKTTLFDLSTENLRTNRMASNRAIRAYVDAAKDTQEWREALGARVPVDAVRDYLVKRFSWKPEDGLPAGDPDAILGNLRSYAEKRHAQHVAKVHLEWARQIGLAVSRRGAGTWYSPSDGLLKALVMSTVTEGREEYHRFLAKLYDRFQTRRCCARGRASFRNITNRSTCFYSKHAASRTAAAYPWFVAPAF